MPFTQKEINDFYDLLELKPDKNQFRFYQQPVIKKGKYPEGIFITRTSYNLKEDSSTNHDAELDSNP